MNTKNEQNQSVWKRYFSGWNFIINALIALIPASIVITIMRELGIRGGLVMFGVLWSFIYLAGWLREKIRTKRSKNSIHQVDDNPHAEVSNNGKGKNSKKKWILAGVTLIVLIVVVALASSSQNDQDISFVKTDKSNEYSEQSGNLYRNTKYNFRIKFPEGWEIKPGDGPNVLQKAVRGNNTISITIKELPAGFNNDKLTIKDVFTLKEFENKLFDESFLQKYPETKLIDSGETKINNLPAFWYKTSSSSSTLDITIDMVGLRYVVLYKNVFYFISAGTVAEEFASIEPEFKKSIATFVLENF